MSKSKPNEVIIVVDDDDESDEETSEADYAADRLSETPFLPPNPKACGPDIIVLDDDDSDEDDSDEDDSETGDGTEREDEGMSRGSEKQGRFMSLKPGFLNF